MHDRLKITTENIMVPPQASREVFKDGDEVDLHNPFRTPGLSTPEEGTARRIEADERMLRQEIPRTHVEMNRDYAEGLGRNLEALRHQEVQKALQREQAFYGEYITEPRATQNGYDLAG